MRYIPKSRHKNKTSVSATRKKKETDVKILRFWYKRGLDFTKQSRADPYIYKLVCPSEPWRVKGHGNTLLTEIPFRVIVNSKLIT